MDKIEKNSIENHYAKGLPKESDLKSTISLVRNIPDKKKVTLHYHTFSIVSESIKGR